MWCKRKGQHEMKRLSVIEIKEIAKKYKGKYEVIAIRTQDIAPFELGEMDHESKVWEDGEESDEGIGGLCATSIDSSGIKMHSSEYDHWSGFYFGDYQAIIGGNHYELGEDDGEVIIQDPVVLEIIF